MGNFKADNQYGNEGEKIIARYLYDNHDVKTLEFNGDYRYDMLAYSKRLDRNILIEQKTDRLITKEDDTGNLAIEIRYRGKPSGVSHTEAEYFIYYLRNLEEDNLWIIKVDELKSLLKTGGFKKVRGGDNNWSEIVLLPRNNVKDWFKVLTV